MQQRAVHNQRDTESNIYNRKPVKQEKPRVLRRRREAIEHHEEQDKPENSIYRLNRELGGGEEEGEQ